MDKTFKTATAIFWLGVAAYCFFNKNFTDGMIALVLCKITLMEVDNATR